MGVREILSVLFLSMGFLSFVIATIGVFRMKDFYCRMHAAGVCESAGLLLCAIGLLIYEGLSGTGIKIFLVLLAVFLASPIGTHIICKVAYSQSLEAEAQQETSSAFAESSGAGGKDRGCGEREKEDR